MIALVAAVLAVPVLILAVMFSGTPANRKAPPPQAGAPATAAPAAAVPPAGVLPHYQYSIYGLTKPLAVAATADGSRIYVTESGGGSKVRVFDRAGKPAGTLAPPASTRAAHTPVYVAINPVTGDIYVSDRATASVYIYNEAGTFLRTFAPHGDLGTGWTPLGLAFDPGGRLYATDVKTANAHRVLMFAPDGTLTVSMGKAGALSFPNGIAVDAQGNVEVADSNNGRLVIFDRAGKMLASISGGEGGLGLPRGVAVGSAGRLYVVDSANHQVRVYAIDPSAAEPAYIGAFGGEGQTDGRFEYPNGVATDTRGHIYVADRENGRVQVWGY